MLYRTWPVPKARLLPRARSFPMISAALNWILRTHRMCFLTPACLLINFAEIALFFVGGFRLQKTRCLSTNIPNAEEIQCVT